MRLYTTFFKKKEGVVLYMALAVLGIISFVALGLSALLLQEQTVAGETTNSIFAFYAAESGIEHGLYLINTPVQNSGSIDIKTLQDKQCVAFNNSECVIGNDIRVGDASYDLTIYKNFRMYGGRNPVRINTKKCPGIPTKKLNDETIDIFCIRSIGKYQKATRAIVTIVYK